MKTNRYVFGLLLLAPTCLFAQTNMDQRFSINVGAFIAERETAVRVDADDGLTPGVDFDFEGDLQQSKSASVGRLDGFYRFSERHRINFSGFRFSRNRSITLQGDLEIGGTVFAIDTVVNTASESDIYKIAYTYSFFQREQGYLGVSAGLHITDISLSVSEENLGQSEARGVTAPLPVLGLRGEYNFAERWRLSASAEFFAITFDDITGRLNDLNVALDYQFSNHVGIGLGYNVVNFDIDIDKTDFVGNLDWEYGGLLLFFKFDF